MREIKLGDITQEEVSSEARLLIDMLRTGYPKLDLRRGTVLRDLLVDADAAVGAFFSAQAREQRESSSLAALSERAAAGEPVDADDVNAILSNFNMASVEGTRARGVVRVFVGSPADHAVLSGVKFSTADGVRFTVVEDAHASVRPTGSKVRQHEGAANWWFLVKVEADEAGSDGNLEQGASLEPDTALADFVSASAYKAFSGGSDLEALPKTVARIKSSLSLRALTTEAAVEARLRDRFDSTDNPVVAVSLRGYGDPEQLRDKHNPFGVGVGGRVDVYVRNFTALPVRQALSMSGSLVDGSFSAESGTASYRLSVSHSDVPGLMFVRSVSDPESNALSSYVHSETWSADCSGTWHDFDVSSDPCEVANTVWRDVSILVEDVPCDGGDPPAEREFRVEAVALPAAADIQAFLDDGTVRNVGSDFVARGPMVVNVSVNAVARCPKSVSFDTGKAVSAICGYVNTSGFAGRLTRSEISTILMGLGASSVDLFDESDMLHGYVYGADGVRRDLSGDALDVSLVADPKAMLGPATCVFVTEPANIQVRAVQAER